MYPIPLPYQDGCAIEVITVTGDVVAWPTERGSIPAVVPAGRYAGFLFSLSALADGEIPLPENTPLYVQGAVSSEPARIPLQHELNFMVPSSKKLYGRYRLLHSP